MRKFLSLLLMFALLCTPALTAEELGETADYFFESEDLDEILDASIFEETEFAASWPDIQIPVAAAILMEKETGTVLYEKNADEQMPPASVTKIMTILLIIEELERGNLSLDTMVTAGPAAAGTGGKQIFLKEGEQMSARDLLKSVIVFSANDASVAMAEHIAGSESAFVARMNERAAELGMRNTVFLNCTGLPEPEGENMTTARDIAVMSRELIRHDMVKEYTTIWTDSLRNGEFGLANTNKLIRYYPGATGLKTGFTRTAKYCLSATAERDGVEYIAVVLCGETTDDRFSSAKTLLSYAFSNYTLIDVRPDEVLLPIPVSLGEVPYVQPVLESTDRILLEKAKVGEIEKVVEMEERLAAPVTQGQRLGTLTVYTGDQELAVIPIVAGDTVNKLTWGQVFVKYLEIFFTGRL